MLDSDALQSRFGSIESVLLWMTIKSGEAVSQVREMKFLEWSFDKDADSASSFAFLLWHKDKNLNDGRAKATRGGCVLGTCLCVQQVHGYLNEGVG